MAEAVSNTSPLVYLHRIERLDLLRALYEEVWIPRAVAEELAEGRRRGHEVPQPQSLAWVEIREPDHVPSKWLSLDLGPGELEAMALGLENPDRVLLLDDALARRTAQAAGLQVAGTLRIVLDAKARGLVPSVADEVNRLVDAGLWVSRSIRERILKLAREQ